MELLKGAPVSAAIREWAAEEIKQLQGPVPKLAIIRVEKNRTICPMKEVL